MQKLLTVVTSKQGLREITQEVMAIIADAPVDAKLCNLFIQHTSASLVIQENADYSARQDLDAWINRLIPEDDPEYTHTYEGADDMPAHLKSAITATSLNIPICNKELLLGRWQGVYLWEHRHQGSARKLIVTII